MIRNWYEKLRFKVLYLFFKFFEVKPFLKIDKNAYCPACGHRNGQIISVTDGKSVNVQHLCEICKWTWQQPTVTLIDPRTIVRQYEQEDDKPEVSKGPFERFVKVTRADVRVNGEPLKPI